MAATSNTNNKGDIVYAATSGATSSSYAASSAASSEPEVITTDKMLSTYIGPISDDKVVYQYFLSREGHLFAFDKDAMEKASETIRSMNEVTHSLMTVGSEIVAPTLFDEIGTQAMDVIGYFGYWKKRIQIIFKDKAPQPDIPKDDPLLVQEITAAANFLAM